ncbi:MAG: hypothetical protein RL708_1655 [Bacteroidota bacterium]|jgi:hypothetical protein
MKKNRKQKLIILISFSFFILTTIIFLMQYPVYKTMMPGYHSLIYTTSKYHQLLGNNSDELIELSATKIEGDKKMLQSEKLFEKHIITMFPYWYGTRWNFNGKTEIPGKGSIACGYFVTTVLKQSGLNIEKNALARLGSEEMIKAICDDAILYRFTNYSMIPFLEKIKLQGVGIYLLGLDTHTGFIWNDGNEIYFVHASGRFPYCVKKEIANESITLWKSKYKVIAKISGDTSVLNKWLNHKPF